MKKVLLLWFQLLLLLPFHVAAQSGQDLRAELQKLAWQTGPTNGTITARAGIKVPQGFVFLDSQNTSRFLELNGNPPRPDHYMIAPENLSWFAVFSFEEQGYVKDDEKLDPDALLKSLKESDADGNDERKKLGMQAIFTDGWQVAPHYDTESKRLEWGTRLRTADGALVVNYTSRLLGRKGIMSAVLVSSPDTLGPDSTAFKALLGGFDYVTGERYSEFKQGDRVAEFGLAALVLGGAAAVATKKGFWAAIVAFLGAFWKVLIGFAVAGLAGIGSLFKKKKSGP